MTQLYHDKVTDLFDEYYTASQDAKPEPIKRIDASNSLVEEYIDQHGKRPPNAVLSRLSTYILLDTLSDSHPDKMSRDEYPIASYGQTGRYFEKHIRMPSVKYVQTSVVGKVKRPYTTNDGAVWVSNGPILPADVERLNETEWRAALYGILPERDAYIVERTILDGFTQAEVASEVGVSQQRIAYIMRRSLDDLSEIFSSYRL